MKLQFYCGVHVSFCLSCKCNYYRVHIHSEYDGRCACVENSDIKISEDDLTGIYIVARTLILELIQCNFFMNKLSISHHLV